jgi:hypothetical protein
MVVGLVKLFFTFIQLTFINDSILLILKEEVKQAILNAEGVPREKINEILNSGMIEIIISPFVVAVIFWINTFFQYLFIGLFISIFHRKR